MSDIGYIALGSNDRPERRLRQGLAELELIVEVLAVSPVYQTPAIDAPDQPDYLNAICRIRTDLSAARLRPLLKAIEQRAGRLPGNPLVALDLDLCLLGAPAPPPNDSRLPHPDLLTRSAVARGMFDLDPSGRHPETGESFRDISARLSRDVPPRPRPDVILSGSR